MARKPQDLLRADAAQLDEIDADLEILMDARLGLDSTACGSTLAQNAIAAAIREIEEAETMLENERSEIIPRGYGH